jgi:cytochrome bd-type quinol oxidase subunit 2
MSFADRVLLWLHIAFVVFAIGPATAAIMSTPRYIRARNLAVTAYLYRITRVFSAASLGVLLFGIVLASTEHKISRPWVTASMTLFVVAAVLLVLIMRGLRTSPRSSGDGSPRWAAWSASSGW